jgi:alkylation response protein AidB-like acyl-CoA dehydrogenase
MELILSDEQRLLFDSAGTFFTRLGGVKRARALRESEAGFDRDVLRQAAANGWLGLLVPEASGGAGLGPTELALILQQAGRVLAPEPVADAVLAALMLAQGEDGAHADLLPRVIAGETVLLPALQEEKAGADPAAIATRARRGVGGLRLDGRKSFVLGAAACDGYLVSARDGDGLVVGHVECGAAGLDLKLAPTVDGRRYGTLTLRDVSARPVAAGAEAAAVLDRCHGLALVAASAEMLGAMEAVIERTLDYMRTRKQFGRAIGSFQALQHRAVDNYVQIEATRSLLYQICAGGEPVAPAMAAALKAVASAAGLAVTKSAVQLHGAIGFTDEYDIGLYLKRAMWLSAHLGNAAVHQQRYAAM